MGSYNEFIVGKGKTKREAFDDAWSDYVYENGHRCSLRDKGTAKLLKRVPPEKQHVEKQGRFDVISMRPDPSAPQSEWLEVWEFEVWVHS